MTQLSLETIFQDITMILRMEYFKPILDDSPQEYLFLLPTHQDVLQIIPGKNLQDTPIIQNLDLWILIIIQIFMSLSVSQIQQDSLEIL